MIGYYKIKLAFLNNEPLPAMGLESSILWNWFMLIKCVTTQKKILYICEWRSLY